MKLLIAYIDNANEIEEHNFNKERCSGRTFEPCHPDYKKKQAVSSAAVLVTARIRINPVMGINVHQMRYGCVQKEEIPFHRKISWSRLLWQL